MAFPTTWSRIGSSRGRGPWWRASPVVVPPSDPTSAHRPFRGSGETPLGRGAPRAYSWPRIGRDAVARRNPGVDSEAVRSKPSGSPSFARRGAGASGGSPREAVGMVWDPAQAELGLQPDAFLRSGSVCRVLRLVTDPPSTAVLLLPDECLRPVDLRLRALLHAQGPLPVDALPCVGLPAGRSLLAAAADPGPALSPDRRPSGAARRAGRHGRGLGRPAVP